MHEAHIQSDGWKVTLSCELSDLNLRAQLDLFSRLWRELGFADLPREESPATFAKLMDARWQILEQVAAGKRHRRILGVQS